MAISDFKSAGIVLVQKSENTGISVRCTDQFLLPGGWYRRIMKKSQGAEGVGEIVVKE